MKQMFKKIAILMLIQVAFAGTFSLVAQEKAGKAEKVKTMKCWASMTCGNCQAKIEKNIAYEKGVKDLVVDLPSKIVTVTYRTDKTSPEKLEKAIQKLGFKTEMVAEEKK
jgi:copper chaperone CopZ